MPVLSATLRDEILDHILGTAANTAPSNVYVALYSSDPTDVDSGTELSGNGYARELVTFDASVAGVSSTDVNAEFGPATADWGSVTHVAVHSSISGSDLIFFGPLATARTVLEDDILRFSAGNLTLKLDQ